MIALLSPAKSLKAYEDASIASELTIPSSDAKKRGELVEKVRKKSASQLKGIMSISDSLAGGVVSMYKSMGNDERAACSALYDGPAYRGLDAGSLSKNEMDHLSTHLRIVSALYGLLRPTDAIQKYRLCFDHKEFECYKHWGSSLADQIMQEFVNQEGGDEGKGKVGTSPRRIILNVASEEYSKAILPHLEREGSVEVIRFSFQTGGKAPSVYSKAARGLFSRWIGLQGIASAVDLDKVKAFNLEGYRFNKTQSKDDHYVFSRASAPAKAPAKKVAGSKRKA